MSPGQEGARAWTLESLSSEALCIILVSSGFLLEPIIATFQWFNTIGYF